MFTLKFELENIREFWHSSSDNKWLAYLNEEINFNFTTLESFDAGQKDHVLNNRIEFLLADICDLHKYPVEDLCFFRYFSHSKFIVSFISKGVTELPRAIYIDACLKHFLFKHTESVS